MVGSVSGTIASDGFYQKIKNMFKNNLKIAWRNLMKDRQFTLLNLLGLSTGLACALLIFLWVRDEMSFDKIFDHDDQVFQLLEHKKTNGTVGVSEESSGPLSETIAAQAPEVQYAAAIAPPDWFQRFTLTADSKNIKAVGQYTGKDYFNIFSFPFLEGDRAKVLVDKNSIVISDQLAKRLFGSTDHVIGKTIRVQHDKDFYVSGVFEQPAYHSSQQFDFVLSFEYLKDIQSWVTSWNNTGPRHYIKLKKGTDVNAFNQRIAGLVTRNSGDSTRSAFAAHFSDLYLHDVHSMGSKTGGRIEYVRLFSLIAAFIVAIACINFMNLSTAKASRRLKEVGIKKVVGAGRAQLVFQFLSESLLLTFFAIIVAILLAWLLLPQFNNLTGKQIKIELGSNLILSILGIGLLTGFLAGSYPALYLSGFNPLAILKGKMKTSFAELAARKGLVVFQFTLSMILIVAVTVIYQQVQYIQSMNPGYNKENIVRFDAEGSIHHTEETFITALKKIPGVTNASFTFNNMVGRNFGTYGLDWTGKDPNAAIYFEGFGSGYEFTETMGMKLAEGRSFVKGFGNDSNKIMLNESAVKVMNLKNPVGKIIRLYDKPMEVIGVVKDFHFESLHEPVKPSYMMIANEDRLYKIMVRVQPEHEQSTLARIQALYESYNPGFPFDYIFLDEAYHKQYTTEARVSTLSKYFAGLAILISCLGLFGLAAFTAQRRQKEIGVRKVIGASVSNITTMLSAEFLKLVFVAVLIAFPISWWAMSQWLQGFAYRINIGADIFLLSGIAVMLITLLTVSYQAIRAALANPVKSLRAE